jgi:AbrB family looped-hinge helix DNA binding protein
MRTTIDAAGRIIIPKPMRDALGLAGGQQVEVVSVDGHLVIDVPSTEMRLERRFGVLVAVPDRDLPVLTASDVRETLDRVRR